MEHHLRALTLPKNHKAEGPSLFYHRRKTLPERPQSVECFLSLQTTGKEENATVKCSWLPLLAWRDKEQKGKLTERAKGDHHPSLGLHSQGPSVKSCAQAMVPSLADPICLEGFYATERRMAAPHHESPSPLGKAAPQIPQLIKVALSPATRRVSDRARPSLWASLSSLCQQ